jgi:hypothetical protein
MKPELRPLPPTAALAPDGFDTHGIGERKEQKTDISRGLLPNLFFFKDLFRSTRNSRAQLNPYAFGSLNIRARSRVCPGFDCSNWVGLGGGLSFNELWRAHAAGAPIVALESLLHPAVKGVRKRARGMQ